MKDRRKIFAEQGFFTCFASKNCYTNNTFFVCNNHVRPRRIDYEISLRNSHLPFRPAFTYSFTKTPHLCCFFTKDFITIFFLIKISLKSMHFFDVFLLCLCIFKLVAKTKHFSLFFTLTTCYGRFRCLSYSLSLNLLRLW